MENGYYLIAGGTPRLDGLGVVPAAVQPAFLEEINQVDEQLFADAASEAGGVPTHNTRLTTSQ
ncbi:unnamed protein product [Callosobruchus maculatus]|uniref:Uncharacterized protein n=1 Tax=Callosobruchus maculatus TaxID=64391 RepID=A0A653BZV9_CALMS|nr:unnamed protein product [Callosobruchus maculatus]